MKASLDTSVPVIDVAEVDGELAIMRPDIATSSIRFSQCYLVWAGVRPIIMMYFLRPRVGFP
jgi:hypothetical protein